jgi:hypothetical protein
MCLYDDEGSIYNQGSSGGGGGGGGVVVPLPEGYEQLDQLELLNYANYGVKIPMTGFRSSFTDGSKLKSKLKFIPKIEDYGSTFIMLINSTYMMVDNIAVSFSDNNLGVYPNYLKWENYLNEIVDLSISTNSVVWNDRTFSISYEPATISTYTIGSKDWGNRCAGFNVIQLEILYNDNLICLCVPAKRQLDQENGLLDLISNEFFVLE